MECDRTFTRRKLSVKLTYQFGRDELTYTLKDRTGELQFPVRYEAINVLEPYKLTVRDSSAYLYLCAPGFVLLAMAAVLRFGTFATVFGLLGIAALFVACLSGVSGVFSIRSSMFKMAPPPAGAGNHGIRVMEGPHHDEIVAELKARWRDRLRRLHLAVNPSNDPKNEAAKFLWMKNQGVISAQEYDRALGEIDQDAPARASEPVAVSPRLN